MCLVIYAWLVAQDYLKNLPIKMLEKNYDEQKNQIEQDMAPFGLFQMVR